MEGLPRCRASPYLVYEELAAVRGADQDVATVDVAEYVAHVGVDDQASASDHHHAIGDQLHLAHQVAGDQDDAALVGEAA